MPDMPVMRSDELKHRFDYHPPRQQRIADLHVEVRSRCGDLADWLNTNLPPSGEAEQALDLLDQVCRASNAAVARHANYAPTAPQ